MLRSDRLATLYLFRPLRSALPARPRRIPILMYHSISEPNWPGAHPYYQTATAPAVFARHMQFLHENGYRPIALPDALGRLETPGRSAEKPPQKPVVITFDDGFEDFYTQAFPVLSQYGFGATMFLPSDYIGHEPRRFNGRACLSWPQVRALSRAGVQFGGHTATHPQLGALDDATIRRELCSSKARIEEELGSSVQSFAYPYAFPDADPHFKKRLRTLLAETDYDHGVTTVIGTAGHAEDRYFLRRLPINSWDDPELFEAKLQGAYDWLRPMQYFSKAVKAANMKRS